MSDEQFISEVEDAAKHFKIAKEVKTPYVHYIRVEAGNGSAFDVESSETFLSGTEAGQYRSVNIPAFKSYTLVKGGYLAPSYFADKLLGRDDYWSMSGGDFYMLYKAVSIVTPSHILLPHELLH